MMIKHALFIGVLVLFTISKANALIVTGPENGVISITGNLGQALDIIDFSISVETNDHIQIVHGSDIRIINSTFAVTEGMGISIMSAGSIFIDSTSSFIAPDGQIGFDSGEGIELFGTIDLGSEEVDVYQDGELVIRSPRSEIDLSLFSGQDIAISAAAVPITPAIVLFGTPLSLLFGLKQKAIA